MSCRVRSNKGHDVDALTYVECPVPHTIPTGGSGTHHMELRSFAPEAVNVEFTSTCDPAGPLAYTSGTDWKSPHPVTLVPPPPWGQVTKHDPEEKVEHDGGSIPGGHQTIEVLVSWRSAGRNWENQIEPLQLTVRC